MVPLDGTELSERIMERATELALACNASVLLVSVLPTHLMEEEIVVDEVVDPVAKGASIRRKEAS